MGALKGVKVLDLSRLLPGPYCTLMMADYGAEVIKIEEPGQGDYIRWRTPAIEGIGARADGLSKILTKGSKVAIDGKLRWSQWERDGQKRSKVEIIVDSLDFMSQRNGGQAPVASAPVAAPAAAPVASPATETFGAGTGEAVPVASAPAPEPADAGAEEPYGEDIPF